MLERIAKKIMSFFKRKKTKIKVINYTKPKKDNPLLDLVMINAIFVPIHLVLFPEFTLVETIMIGLMLTLTLSKQARHFVKHSPELMRG